MTLKILYRGPLKSCNFACPYCPFAKQQASQQQLDHDRQCLGQFLSWLEKQGATGLRFELLLTPFGEALIHPWYQAAIASLSHAPYIQKIAIQTNLSCDVQWLSQCHTPTTALWVSYHPAFLPEATLLYKCQTMDTLGIRHSVGVVGIKEHFANIESLRQKLNPATYLWVNAFKREPDYYSPADHKFLAQIDPHFEHNTHHYPTLNLPCGAGESVVSIEGNGDLRRCHFISTVRGNIYRDSLASMLRPEGCTNQTCHCHIGYVHLKSLALDRIFGDGLLERIPILPNKMGMPTADVLGA